MSRLPERLRARRRDYAATFESDTGRRVLRDLHRFCMRPTPTADPHEAVFAMGMQRVFRRIEAMLRLDAEALIQLIETDQETDDA